MYYYVMKNRKTGELNLISHEDYREYNIYDSDLIYNFDMVEYIAFVKE